MLVPIDVSILQQLLKLFNAMKERMSFDNNQNLLSFLQAQPQVGVDQVGVKVFETGHPYER